MRKQNWTRHVIAFVAAGVIVFTALDLWIVWRNQSADRVMKTRDGTVLYQKSDYAVGSILEGQSEVATVLRLSPDGGWSLEGSAPWLGASDPYAKCAVVRNLSSGPVGSYWLCVVEKSEALTSVQLYNVNTHKVEEQYDLHRGGVIEPVILHPGTALRLLHNESVLLTIPIKASQIP